MVSCVFFYLSIDEFRSFFNVKRIPPTVTQKFHSFVLYCGVLSGKKRALRDLEAQASSSREIESFAMHTAFDTSTLQTLDVAMETRIFFTTADIFEHKI